jgi:hypothetical protein
VGSNWNLLKLSDTVVLEDLSWWDDVGGSTATAPPDDFLPVFRRIFGVVVRGLDQQEFSDMDVLEVIGVSTEMILVIDGIDDKSAASLAVGYWPDFASILRGLRSARVTVPFAETSCFRARSFAISLSAILYLSVGIILGSGLSFRVLCINGAGRGGRAIFLCIWLRSYQVGSIMLLSL